MQGLKIFVWVKIRGDYRQHFGDRLEVRQDCCSEMMEQVLSLWIGQLLAQQERCLWRTNRHIMGIRLPEHSGGQPIFNATDMTVWVTYIQALLLVYVLLDTETSYLYHSASLSSLQRQTESPVFLHEQVLFLIALFYCWKRVRQGGVAISSV